VTARRAHRDGRGRSLFARARSRGFRLLWLAVAAGAAVGAGSSGGGRVPDRRVVPLERPSFVVFLVDDLGWTDTGAYGSRFYETPHADRLAAEGARFTQFYAASPVCSPTRASLMTGQHPARLHLTNWIGGEEKGRLLPADYIHALPLAELTLGEAFQRAGYRTGYIGKWHLGAKGHMPGEQGFEFVLAVNEAGQPGSYFHPYESPERPITNVPDLGDGARGEYLTDPLTEEAVRFLRENRDRPFLLVLSHYAVHTPLQAKPQHVKKYERRAAGLPEPARPLLAPEGEAAVTKIRQDHPVYAGMVESMDESLGRVLETLDRLGLDSRTAVIFVSDNGGLSTLRGSRPNIPTSNHPLRAGKGWLYEGGIRIPFVVRWPGVVEDGRVIDWPAVTMDLLPTLLDMARLPLLPRSHRDGVSLWSLLRGSPPPGPRDLHWHFPHYHGSGNTPSGAIRSGDLKLVEWFEKDRVELYDLARDPAESDDLAASRPRETARLRQQLGAWRRSVDARMPSPNPDWPE
jgi:arylsulfatase A-like enzyme